MCKNSKIRFIFYLRSSNFQPTMLKRFNFKEEPSQFLPSPFCRRRCVLPRRRRPSWRRRKRSATKPWGLCGRSASPVWRTPASSTTPGRAAVDRDWWGVRSDTCTIVLVLLSKPRLWRAFTFLFMILLFHIITIKPLKCFAYFVVLARRPLTITGTNSRGSLAFFPCCLTVTSRDALIPVSVGIPGLNTLLIL